MTGAFYNEIDPYAARWLRNLIAAGLIADGVVDERSIVDIDPGELAGYTQCHFFAGIGVWSHALRMAGWPDARPVWTGSCPCQPFSSAGKQGGYEDARHLWPTWFRLIRERRPPAVFGEQVASSDGLAWLDLVSTDLEGAGYAVGAADLCAAGVGAPHIRQRLFFVAHADGRRHLGAGRDSRVQAGDRAQLGLSVGDLLAGLVADAQRAERGQGALGRGDDHATLARGAQGSGGSGEHGAAGGMADTDRQPREPGHGRGGRGRAGPQGDHLSGGGGAPGLVGDARDSRLEGHGERLAASSGWDAEVRPAPAPGEPRGLGDADRRGGEGRAELRQPDHCLDAGPTRGVADAERGLVDGRADIEERGPEGRDADRGTGEWTFWSDADWVACRDGKARPVEPGTFPLAHGAPARVGRLRAYGNAICAPAACAFILATGLT